MFRPKPYHLCLLILIMAMCFIGVFLVYHMRQTSFYRARNRPPITHGEPAVVIKTNRELPVYELPTSLNTSASPNNLVYVPRASASECSHLRRPENVRETFQFQQVDGKNKTIVFSAFLDERDDLVRVIAARLANLRSGYTCHLWYHSTSSDLSITSASTENLPEHHGRKYTAAYIHCPLPKTRRDVPYAVALTSRDCHSDVTPPTNVLRVMTSEGRKVHNFTVCMKPVNKKYSRAHEVVEFVEMSRLLGASKVQVYVTSAGANVLHVLKWYQTQGMVEIIDWKIDNCIRVEQWPPSSKQPPEIHAWGQISVENDCLFRNRQSSRYLVMADWDEVLVPKKHANWMDLITAVDHQNKKPACEYRFPCLFFHKDFPTRQEDFPGKDLALKYHSMTVLVNQREKKPVPPPARAKYIIDPEKVHVAGIHFVHKHRKDKSSLQVFTLPQKLGASYHYRNWEKPHEFSKLGVQDDDMLRFKDILLRRLEEVWSHFADLPMDIPLSVYGGRV